MERLIDSKPSEPIGGKPMKAMNLEEFIMRQENTYTKIITYVTLPVFEGVKSGVVNLIFRNPSKRLANQLTGKKYYYVEVQNYLKEKCVAEYDGYFIASSDHYVKFNGLERILVKKGDFIIKLGNRI